MYNANLCWWSLQISFGKLCFAFPGSEYVKIVLTLHEIMAPSPCNRLFNYIVLLLWARGRARGRARVRYNTITIDNDVI